MEPPPLDAALVKGVGIGMGVGRQARGGRTASVSEAVGGQQRHSGAARRRGAGRVVEEEEHAHPNTRKAMLTA